MRPIHSRRYISAIVLLSSRKVSLKSSDQQRALRVCLHSVDVPNVHLAPMFLNFALLIRSDVPAARRDIAELSRSEAIGSNDLCTPGMGVNLWGESPLYVNPVNGLNIDTSTSRRQGRNREGPSEGSRSAKL
jgi:hypothetical protein